MAPAPETAQERLDRVTAILAEVVRGYTWRICPCGICRAYRAATGEPEPSPGDHARAGSVE